jgi:hypothetical protein
MVEQPLRWLLDGLLLSGSVNILSALSGEGKSTIAAAIAAAVTSGTPLPGFPRVGPADVVWLSREEDVASVVKRRLRLSGADLHRVWFPEHRTSGARRTYQFPDDAGELAGILAEVKPALVVIDPIQAYVAPNMLAEAGSTARAVCDALGTLARPSAISHLLLKNDRKDQTGPARLRCSGSAEWTNYPRNTLAIGRDPADPKLRLLASSKASLYHEPPSLRFRVVNREGIGVAEVLGVSKLTADELAQGQGSRVTREKYEAARALLMQQLADGPKRSQTMYALAKANAIGESSFDEARLDLGITWKWVVRNEEKYVEWSAPEGGFNR